MASAMDRVQNLQSEITCGICWTYSSQPVTMDCGHSFCPECLSSSWRVGATPFSCPECRQGSEIRELPLLNVSLENLTEVGNQFSCHHLQNTERQSLRSPEEQSLGSPEEQEQNLWSPEEQSLRNTEVQGLRNTEVQGLRNTEVQGLRNTEVQGLRNTEVQEQNLQSTKGQRQCPTHKEVLKFFCEEDQTLLCVSCCQMSEHRAHKLSPVDEAVHNYRKKLQEILSHLGKDFEEAEKLLSQEEVENPVDWRWMISEEFCKLQYFLLEENFHCLRSLEIEESTRKVALSWHIQTLQEIIKKVDESSQKSDLDLLKDLRELWGRSESVLAHRPKAVDQKLRQYPITGMVDIVNKFRVDIRVHPQYDDTYVTVSKDLKSMRAGERWQVDPNQPENSRYHYVFAEQVFKSGRHYWEVDVTQIPQWVLGVYTPYLVTGMGRNVSSRASLFLLHCVKKGDHYNLETYPGSLNHQVKDPVPRVGVYLDYSIGSVLFYNVLQHSLIYRFCRVPFTEPVGPVFSPDPPLPGTKPGPMTICSIDSHLCSCCYSSS